MERVEGTDAPTENGDAKDTPTKARENIKFNGIFFSQASGPPSDITLISEKLLGENGQTVI